MLKLSQETTKKLVVIHGWSGISLGILLYAVLVTGMVAVFSEEIAHWSSGLVNTDDTLAVPMDSTQTPLQGIIDELLPQVKPEYIEEVALSGNTLGHLNVFFHKHQTNAEGNIEEFGTQFEVDRNTGAVISEQTGSGLDLFSSDEDRALSRFLVSVHTELHLPRPWGLILTGILGLAMMVAAVSGLIMHRHLLKDIFTLRRGSLVLAVKDAHTVAGSWGLPFAFVLAFTGSFFSFAGSIGLPLMAMVGFGGDQEAMFDTLIGSKAPEDATPTRGAAVDDLLRDVQQRTGAPASFLVVQHYGRADAMATVFLPVLNESLSSDPIVYSAASGDFVKVKPQVGQEPSAGASLLALMAPLHFGNFMGLVSKTIWFALGFAMCYVTVTGIDMWLARRSPESFRLLRASMSIITYGIPLALLGSAMAFFLSYGSGSASFWTPTGFVIASGLILTLAALRRDNDRLHRELAIGTAMLCVIVVALRIASGGPGWLSALSADQAIIISMDLLLLFAAAAIGSRLWLAAAEPTRVESNPQPISLS